MPTTPLPNTVSLIEIFDHGGQRHHRYVFALSREWTRFKMYQVGCALLTAAQTARPGFREMADTLRWEDIR